MSYPYAPAVETFLFAKDDANRQPAGSIIVDTDGNVLVRALNGMWYRVMDVGYPREAEPQDVVYPAILIWIGE